MPYRRSPFSQLKWHEKDGNFTWDGESVREQASARAIVDYIFNL